jgi:hypothetical protein
MSHVTGFVDVMANGVRRVLGIAAAMLPARWWPWLDFYLPVTTSSTIAGVATLLLGAAIGIPGFLDYTQYAISSANATAVEVAKRNPDVDNVGELLRRGPIAFSALSLPLFLFTTPAGWVTMYLGGSGLLRAIASVVDNGFGDPLLTAVDTLLMRTRRRTIAAIDRSHRESLEGPEMPDRIMGAVPLHVADAEFVIVASRRKADWDRGTVVVTPDGTSYRVVAIEERTMAGRLRTLYALKAHTDGEVFRRFVHYELPPGRHS